MNIKYMNSQEEVLRTNPSPLSCAVRNHSPPTMLMESGYETGAGFVRRRNKNNKKYKLLNRR